MAKYILKTNIQSQKTPPKSLNDSSKALEGKLKAEMFISVTQSTQRLRDTFQIVQASLICCFISQLDTALGSILLQQGNSPYVLLGFFPSFGRPNPVLFSINGRNYHLLDRCAWKRSRLLLWGQLGYRLNIIILHFVSSSSPHIFSSFAQFLRKVL